MKTLDAPQSIQNALRELANGLQSACGDNLEGLIAYGAVARGNFEAGISSVNIVVVLKDVSGDSLEQIVPVLRNARRLLSIEPMILTPSEIRSAADVFPVKFLGIKEHHVVLCGKDPFDQLEVSTDHLRLRIEQELRNYSMRMRRRFINASIDTAVARQLLSELARPLSLTLGALLQIKGRGVSAKQSEKSILEAAADQFSLDKEALVDVFDQSQERTPESILFCYAKVMESIDKATRVADEHEDG